MAEEKVKPTFRKPQSDQAKKMEKQFSDQLRIGDVSLEEADSLLNEKEQSLKKKIFDLAKMEALVHGDQMLSAVYNEMAEDGGEKYGYHYNETIMNLIFNEYVMNSPKYLQKYKMAIPKEKKRRDKSGIHKLQQVGKVEQIKQQQIHRPQQPKGHIPTASNPVPKPPKAEGEIHNNSLPGTMEEETSGNFGIATGAGGFDINRDGVQRTKQSYDTMEEPIREHHAENREEKIDVILQLSYDDARDVARYSKEELDALPDDKIEELYRSWERAKLGVEETTGAASSGGFAAPMGFNMKKMNEMDLDSAKAEAQRISGEEGVAQHVNQVGNDSYNVSDWYDSDSTVASFENGRPLNENQEINPDKAERRELGDDDIDMNEEINPDKAERRELGDDDIDMNETTGSGSSGAYYGPFGKHRDKKLDQPAWKGGEIIGESNYLIDPNGFKKYLKEMDETKLREPELRKPGLKEFDMDDSLVPTMAEAPFSADKLKNIDTQMLGNMFVDLLANLNKYGNAAKELGVPESIAMLKNIIELRPDKQKLSPEAQQALANKGFWARFKSWIGMGEGENLDEKAKSKAQQRFMGMVHAAQKGELDNPSPAVKKAAASMSDKDAEDFASTKQKGLPEKVGEGSGEAIGSALGGIGGAALTKSPMGATIGSEIGGTIGKQFDEGNLNEAGFEGVVQYDSERAGEEPFELNGNKWQFVNAIYPDGKKDIGVYRFGHDLVYDYGWWRKQMGLDESMIDQQPDSMKLGNDNGTSMKLKSDGMGMDMGMEDTSISPIGGIGESVNEDVSQRTKCNNDEEPSKDVPINQPGGCKKKEHIAKQDREDATKNPHNIASRKKRLAKYEKELEAKKGQYSKELEKHKQDMEKQKEKAEGKVNEDKKPSSLVLKDRIGQENEENFKKDMADSNTEMLKTKDGELAAQEQIEKVPDNPYELGEKIEKEHLKTNDGKAFKNVGDSTNDEGDEIPKRNMTAPEQVDVNMYRKGLQDWVFDNKPSERFEKRMEKDMGEEIYNQRKEKMEFQADAPMYNKDAQPIEDTEVKKDQFDKYKSGWNKRDGIKESMITGKYRDEFGNTKFVNFKINETVEKEEGMGIPLNLEGMGNSYTTRVNENTEMRKFMDSFDFYMNGKEVVRVKTGKQTLSESEEKQPKLVNEQVEKMKKLMGYDPSQHINTDSVKKNRNF